MRKAKEMGVEMPKYMKPGAVNPLSYASQMQKRKQLWAKPNPEKTQQDTEVPEAAAPATKPGGSYNNWESTNFGNDKVNEKFRRLMGIKGGGGDVGGGSSSAPEQNQSYTKIMNDLDRNYEAARQQTHRNRGIGLGFSDSAQYQSQPPVSEQPPPGPGWQNRHSGVNFVRKQ